MSADERGVEAADSVARATSRAPAVLADLINRVLDRGVVVGGDVTLSVAGVDLVYLRLSALLTSVATAREKLGAGRERREVPAREAHGGIAARLPSLSSPAPMPAPLLAPPSQPKPPPPESRPPVDAQGIDRSSGLQSPRSLPGALDADLARVAESFPDRLEIDPDAVQRDLARLVLTVVELLRRVVEHQAVRRMDDPDLTAAQVERMGIALDRLEQQMRELTRVFGLADDDLNIDLGDLGTLL